MVGRGRDDALLEDPLNLEILRRLREDPRQPVAKLARAIGMSAPAVAERILRLEEAGVIRGVRLELDPAALGYPIALFVRVRPSPGQLSKIIELARGLPEVSECHRITGEDCFLMKVHIRALDQLDTFLDRFLLYGQTTTSILQSSPVPPRGPPLPGAD
jgi:Lrp/AsnC family leucine-responsive transcriptional regulator